MAGSHLDVDARPARRSLHIVAGAVVLLALAWFFFMRGAAEPTGATLPSDVPAGTVEAEVQVAQAAPTKAHKETFEVFAPKDPFDPLVEPETADETKGGKGAATPDGGHVVGLNSVLNDMEADVSIDDSAYTVTLGDTFADSFQLVSVGGKCASLLYGDEQFTVCEGQEVTK